MKTKQVILSATWLILTLAACNNSGTKTNTGQTVVDSKGQGKTNDTIGAVYSCPMDTDYHSNKPGKCPKCGMTLIRTK